MQLTPRMIGLSVADMVDVTVGSTMKKSSSRLQASRRMNRP